MCCGNKRGCLYQDDGEKFGGDTLKKEMYMTIKTKTMVLVKWKDIISKDEWQKYREAECTKPQLFVSIGWLIRRNKDYLVIASCYSPEDDTVGTVTSIPTGTLVEVKELRHHPMKVRVNPLP